MSYEKQTWQTGDVITSAKLNHMEDGISDSSGIMWVHLTTTDPNGATYTADVSRSDIMGAMTNQTPVFATLLYVTNDIITFGGTFGVGFIAGELVFYVEPSKPVYSIPQGDEYTWTMSMQ